MQPKPDYPLNGPSETHLPDGRPRPIHPDTGRPLMAEGEANWHAHVSGMAERQQVESAGSDPAAVGTLLSATAGEAHAPSIGPHTLRPLTLGTIKTLRRVGSIFTRENPSGQPMAVDLDDLALAALVFARPDWVWAKLEAGEDDEIRRQADGLAFHLTAGAMRVLNAFINSQMAEFFGEESTEKKPGSPETPATPSTGSAAAGPPAADGSSPSSSCSPPSMDAASSTRFGDSRLPPRSRC